MKKNPFKKYEKETKKNAYIGVMAEEGIKRIQDYLRFGCNAFEAKRPISRPIGFWTEQDVLLYMKKYNLPYASVYGEIIENNGRLSTTKADRTGCVFCCFGCHLEKEPNRFQRMKDTHPQLYEYCINKLEIGKVLDYINVKYK